MNSIKPFEESEAGKIFKVFNEKIDRVLKLIVDNIFSFPHPVQVVVYINSDDMNKLMLDPEFNVEKHKKISLFTSFTSMPWNIPTYKSYDKEVDWGYITFINFPFYKGEPTTQISEVFGGTK